MDAGVLGDVATWVTAVATCAALGAAVWAVRRSGELLRIEQRRDEARDKHDAELREDAARAAQADLVAAWSHMGTTPKGRRSWGVLITNQSALPSTT